MADALFPKKPVVLIDDEELLLISYDTILRMAGYSHIISCSDSRDAMDLLKKQGAEVVLLDLTMPYLPGDELLSQMTQQWPGVPVIIVTGNDTVESAVQCMKNGAFDYLAKPVHKERLLATIEQAITFHNLSRENRRLKERLLKSELKHPEIFAPMITINEEVHAIFRYIEAIAKLPYSVLITGETGVGKELLAKAVHASSQRKGAFVAVNVAGLDENTFSDTLFGHIKGAFTGADQLRKGMVEQATNGTLFLDEIGDLTLGSQVKLLRLLQECEYFPIGSDQPKRTNARIVAATNQDLEALQESGNFRRDLYYRLRTHHVHIPPLRKRLEDLPLLLDHFLEEAANTLAQKKPHPSKEIFTLLSSYHFPGNIRELQAMVLDAVSGNPSTSLSLDSLKAHIFKKDVTVETIVTTPDMKDTTQLVFGKKLPTIKEAKGMLIEEALRRANGNKSLAAEMLGMSRQALNWRAKQES